MDEFKFRVKSVFHVQPRNWWSLAGVLEVGLRVAVGDEGIIDGDPSRRVTITAVPIVCGATDELLEICIDQPSFPPKQLEGALIVGVHRPRN
jgi:hypothetical protein